MSTTNGLTRVVTRLYIRRKELGLSQREAEKQLGIPHSLYSALESGRLTKPYPRMIEKLEEFYKMKIARLLEEVEIEEVIRVKR